MAMAGDVNARKDDWEMPVLDEGIAFTTIPECPTRDHGGGAAWLGDANSHPYLLPFWLCRQLSVLSDIIAT